MRDIKSKPKEIKRNTHCLKTTSSYKSKKAVLPMNVADSLKHQYVKTKTELKKQTENNNERPENYAVNEIEEKSERAVYTSADVVQQSSIYFKERIKQKKDRSFDIPKIPVSEKPIQESTLIKTKENILSEKIQKNICGQPKIKSNHQAVIKNKGIVIPEKLSNTSSEPVVRIKTKEEYLKSNIQNKTYRLKQKRVYNPKNKLINPKTIQAALSKQAERRLANDKSIALKKYIKSKLKYKVEDQTAIAQTESLRTSNNNTLTEKSIQSELPTYRQNSNPKEKIKIKKTDIKTRNDYIRLHYGDKIGIKAKSDVTESMRTPLQEKQIIKSKPQNTVKLKSEPSSRFKSERKMHMNKPPKNRVKKFSKRAVSNTRNHITKQAAKQSAKKAELIYRSGKSAKALGKDVVRFTVKVAHVIAASVRTIVSAIATLSGWIVLLVVLIIIIIIASIAASPFGIFISEEVNEIGSILLSQIISEYNIELTQEVENIELSVEHTDAEIIDNRTDNNIVIAVFAAKVAGTEDDSAEDVVIFDENKAERLKEYFRTANTVEYSVVETSISGDEGTTVDAYLTITIKGKTKEELMDEYNLTDKQREAVETLLEHGDVITSSSHSLAITNADVESIIKGLPEDLPQTRKDVVKNAGSLVGKVNYFWGGKSSAIGWDPAWGTMRRVTAAGSPSSGTLRAYGLDCSGFVTWVFNNSGMGYSVGHGTYGQRDASIQVSASTVQAGDLTFLSSYSHVGIVVGKDTDGNILVIHCSSSANNVVISTAQSVGFTVFRRPNCY